MANKVCKRCKDPKEASDFYRESDKTCKTCVLKRQKELREAKNGGGSQTKIKTKRKAKAEAPAAPEPIAAPSPTLTMTPGYGFAAVIEEGVLKIEQGDAQGNVDTLLLSRTEARVLFAEFHDWATAPQ